MTIQKKKIAPLLSLLLLWALFVLIQSFNKTIYHVLAASAGFAIILFMSVYFFFKKPVT